MNYLFKNCLTLWVSQRKSLNLFFILCHSQLQLYHSHLLTIPIFHPAYNFATLCLCPPLFIHQQRRVISLMHWYNKNKQCCISTIACSGNKNKDRKQMMQLCNSQSISAQVLVDLVTEAQGQQLCALNPPVPKPHALTILEPVHAPLHQQLGLSAFSQKWRCQARISRPKLKFN